MENFVKEMLKQSVKKAVNSLGIEGAREAIERIYTIKLRENLLNVYFEYTRLKK